MCVLKLLEENLRTSQEINFLTQPKPMEITISECSIEHSESKLFIFYRFYLFMNATKLDQDIEYSNCSITTAM